MWRIRSCQHGLPQENAILTQNDRRRAEKSIFLTRNCIAKSCLRRQSRRLRYWKCSRKWPIGTGKRRIHMSSYSFWSSWWERRFIVKKKRTSVVRSWKTHRRSSFGLSIGFTYTKQGNAGVEADNYWKNWTRR